MVRGALYLADTVHDVTHRLVLLQLLLQTRRHLLVLLD